MLELLGYHIRNPPKKYVESGPFAVCSDHGTRESYHSLPCAKVTAHDKDSAFAMCIAVGTRQRGSLCHVPGREAHGKGSCYVILAVEPKSLPWVRFGTRQRLCRVLEILHTAKAAFADGCLLCALCRVRHTARQSLCRGFFGLRRVLWAHDK